MDANTHMNEEIRKSFEASKLCENSNLVRIPASGGEFAKYANPTVQLLWIGWREAMINAAK